MSIHHDDVERDFKIFSLQQGGNLDWGLGVRPWYESELFWLGFGDVLSTPVCMMSMSRGYLNIWGFYQQTKANDPGQCIYHSWVDR